MAGNVIGGLRRCLIQSCLKRSRETICVMPQMQCNVVCTTCRRGNFVPSPPAQGSVTRLVCQLWGIYFTSWWIRLNTDCHTSMMRLHCCWVVNVVVIVFFRLLHSTKIYVIECRFQHHHGGNVLHVYLFGASQLCRGVRSLFRLSLVGKAADDIDDDASGRPRRLLH
jgi:hypothetical protein